MSKKYKNPKPLYIKERFSYIFLEKGFIDVKDNAFVLIGKDKIRTQIPIGSVACIFLEPGTRISHEAVKLASYIGTLLVWVGEAGVRLYSVGQPGGARSDRLLWQASLVLNSNTRLKVVRKMFELRFGEKPPEKRSVAQLRGLEGARVKNTYKLLARQYGVKWKGRKYDIKKWDKGSKINKCLSAATSCLYGITEAAILAAGFAPALGFIHTGKPRSFVYDIADIIKFETVVPIAFRKSKSMSTHPERLVRRECRDSFRKNKTLKKLIPLIFEILEAGELPIPMPGKEQKKPVIPRKDSTGNVGHRGEKEY